MDYYPLGFELLISFSYLFFRGFMLLWSYSYWWQLAGTLVGFSNYVQYWSVIILSGE